MLKLRYPASCRVCSARLRAGTRAQWDPVTRSVTCVSCATADAPEAIEMDPPAVALELDRGLPGASAQREAQRRRRRREGRTRDRHPRVGGLLLAVRGTPAHETAFIRGGAGEMSVARSLQRRTAKGPAVILHDRRMPYGRGNIDHLAVTATGVYVIDAKNIAGDVRVSRPPLGYAKLLIKGRDRTKLVDGLDRQVAAVRQALADLAYADVCVFSSLCFTSKANLPVLGRTEIRGHQLRHPRAVARKLNRTGPLDDAAIDSLARALAAAFPPA